jgi:acetylornithine deacetylase
MTLSAAEEKVLDLLAQSREELMELVSAAVRTASVTGQEAAFGSFVMGWLRDAGLDVQWETIGEDFRRQLGGFEAEHDLGERGNVYAWLRAPAPGSAAPLVVSTHLDVVPTGQRSAWVEDPFSGVRRDGRIWGRGTADMKGNLCAALFALRALRDSGLAPRVDVQLQAVCAEESGGLGTLKALATQPTPQAAIVLEPTEGAVSPACAGCIHFTTTVVGRAAHAAVPWKGVSALDKMVHTYRSLQGLAEARQQARSHPLFAEYPDAAPLSVGVATVGEWRSTVPDRAQMIARLGVMPDETIDEVRAQIVDAVATAAKDDEWLAEHPPLVTWDNAGFPGWETDRSATVVQVVEEAVTDVGGSARVAGVTYGSDAGHFATRGIPTVQFGGGSIGDAHSPNEFIEEDAVLATAQATALAIARFRP